MRKISILMLLILISFVCDVQSGPLSKYYMVQWQNAGMQVIQGNNVVQSWASAGNCELAVAVNGTIKTAAYYYSGGYGVEYSLTGTNMGSTYPVYYTYHLHDGTTDGTYNYAIEWASQQIYRFDTNWSNPQAIFSTSGLGLGNMLGITYDPTDKTLWLQGHGNYNIAHVTMSGTLLGSFTINEYYAGALAMDYADNTLWYYAYNAHQLHQYSRTGVLLQQANITGLGSSLWGGEFDLQIAVPEPATFSLVGLFVIALYFFKKQA